MHEKCLTELEPSRNRRNAQAKSFCVPENARIFDCEAKVSFVDSNAVDNRPANEGPSLRQYWGRVHPLFPESHLKVAFLLPAERNLVALRIGDRNECGERWHQAWLEEDVLFEP
jgi:hypothetical protein